MQLLSFVPPRVHLPNGGSIGLVNLGLGLVEGLGIFSINTSFLNSRLVLKPEFGKLTLDVESFLPSGVFC